MQKSSENGVFYLTEVHAATFASGEYTASQSGQTLDFRFHHGKWQFEASGGIWKDIDGTNTVVSADVGGSADAVIAFNAEVLPTLLRLNNGEEAAFEYIAKVEEVLTRGEYYLQTVHDAPAPTPAGEYAIAKLGQTLDFRFHQGKWQFEANGGTWKEINATNTVAAADVGANNTVAAAYNSSLLPVLRRLNAYTV